MILRFISEVVFGVAGGVVDGAAFRAEVVVVDGYGGTRSGIGRIRPDEVSQCSDLWQSHL